jgi:DNA recombination protein RmuC
MPNFFLISTTTIFLIILGAFLWGIINRTKKDYAQLLSAHNTLKSEYQQTQISYHEAQKKLAQLEERITLIPNLENERDQLKKLIENLQNERLTQQTSKDQLETELTTTLRFFAQTKEEMNLEKLQHKQTLADNLSITTENSALKTQLEMTKKDSEAKLALLNEAKDTLTQQFKILAQDILEEKSKRFTEHNETQMTQLLNPLKERLAEFKSKVEEIHLKDAEQQSELRTELKLLKELNQQITTEAHGLTTALKGQAKKQGNWGELILSTVLERSGLREGHEYIREASMTTEDGKRQRPDVIIKLPQNRHLIIDAKVSLNAYTRYINAEQESDRTIALSEHAQAIATHIKELSDRNYFDLPDLQSPDMVFMFIPIESAFSEAIRFNSKLFQEAIDRNILVATPTTLLTSLNIVRQLWRFEQQNTQASALADRAVSFYDKLVGFLENFVRIGSQLDKAKETYNEALGQFHMGKGNLIWQAKQLGDLGVRTKKNLPEDLVNLASLELPSLPDSLPLNTED